ncbi:tRNA uracil 4-sulfurtransferase ThiI [Alkalilimnicola ehrlichii MLHE-1]|uniref:Probable tRNA sulfurtransferase n=1 Tax=Alkalilimnicola ehrlichii (strain ATCC BAA-1101 / DSM 17681 / MLHE-1) TaxID=187272 RepID=Q0A9U9_ALKEH|nr:tRNA uracil 4-sulfurtransferase ThiI [Alkalilimnicola ehrlichii]ABI56388.1 thiamine biosynthesis/tRNA modification protein ThiI [Alkalilimnicola ehrlichii MLHE-1]
MTAAQPADQRPVLGRFQPNRLLIHYGEVALKGRNRSRFERALRHNLRHRLRAAGLRPEIHQGHQRIWVDLQGLSEAQRQEVLQAAAETPGIVTYQPVHYLAASADRQAMLEQARMLLSDLANRMENAGQGSFAVRVKRADKRFPLPSDQIAARIGQTIIEHSPWQRVDLRRPDQTFHLDIYSDGMYCYGTRHRGLGGLPVGPGGRALTLLSGGIDSPVAAFLMAKRGCRVDFLHFTASPSQQRADADHTVIRLARQLSRYTGHSRLYMVPYDHFDMALHGDQRGHEVVLFRRFVARTGEALAKRLRALALISGDSLGQVASQTMENMVSTSLAVRMPIMRPLVGLDKADIVAIGRRIGTYDISIQPYKDCCALLDHQPRTRTLPSNLEAIEAQLGLDDPALVEATLADAVCLEFAAGRDLKR